MMDASRVHGVEIPDQIRRVLAADRKFFERHSGRRHRFRLAAPSEIEQAAERFGTPKKLPDGQRLFVMVFVPDADPAVRLRFFGSSPEGMETDQSEEFLRALHDKTAAKRGDPFAPENRLRFHVVEDRDADDR